jgi:hypothetical protein
VYEYEDPTTALVFGLSSVRIGAVPTVSTIAAVVAEPWTLLAVTSNVEIHVVVGVPERIPVVGSSESPGGREPADTAKVGAGLPEATKV